MMGSAFDSFDASPLGARVQSAVDGTGAFGGGTVISGEGIYRRISTFSDTWTTGSPSIPCGTGTWITVYNPSESNITVSWNSMEFTATGADDGHSIFDAGVFQLLAACGSSPAITITGQTSGATLSIPGQSRKKGAASSVYFPGSVNRTQNVRSPFSSCAISTSYVVPDVSGYGVDTFDDVSSIIYRFHTDGSCGTLLDPFYVPPEAIPAELQFTIGETVSITLEF